MPRLDLFRRANLRDLRIGVRLRLAFAGVLALLFLGAAVSVWQFRAIRGQVQSVSRTEHRMTAVLHLDNSFLNMMSRLQRAADNRRAEEFQREAARSLAGLRAETAWAAEELRTHPPAGERQRIILASLLAMVDSLPARVDSLAELARNGDWTALNARLSNRVDHTDDVISDLVRQIDEDLSIGRRALLDDIQQAQNRAAQLLALTGLFSVLAAALLGFLVTRSITSPLAQLHAGTQALAAGDFAIQVSSTGGDELAHLASVFNQTARQLADLYRNLRLSEAHFRSLIENASDLIVIAGASGELMYVSPSSFRVLGYAPERLAGQTLAALVHPDDASAAGQLFATPPGGVHPFELRFRCQDGSLRILEGVATNLLLQPAVAGIVLNARDISDRRHAEQVLREREDQLRQSQKMEAIGCLAGGVAHDFNNLLTVINGYCELLLGRLEAGHPERGYVEEVRDAGERAADLTRQLLAFSRRQVLQPAVLQLNQTVHDTEKILRRVIGEDILLVCELDAEAGNVEADANQLRQVILNLAVNARDAMPGGGRLVIRTANVEMPETAGGYPPPGSYVQLSIADTGHGMDEATRQRIFEPFFTTKGPGKGTGLGLAIVFGIISQSGGWIVVDSAPGCGSTFHIYLPRVARPMAARDAAFPAAALPGRETILLVEDQDEVRRFAAASLKSLGYRVLEAGDGEEALRLYQAHAESIDLLLTDVVMPGMTGVELSRRLRALDQRLPVIFASGYADSVILNHGVLEVSAGLLPKPYSPSALASKIREMLDD